MRKDKVKENVEEFNEATMIDEDTAVIDCPAILAQVAEGDKEPKTRKLNGHIISTLDVNTGAATITVSVMKDAKLSIGIPFWACADVIKLQLARFTAALEEAEKAADTKEEIAEEKAGG